MSRGYYVLQDGNDRRKLADKLNDAFDELKDKEGLLFIYRQTDELDGAIRMAWKERKTNGVVELVEDPEIPAQYVQVQTAKNEHAEAIGKAVMRHLRTLPLETLERQAKEKPDDPRALMRLSLAAPEASSPVILSLLRAGFSSSHAPVREAAAMGATMTGWSELAPDLKQCLKLEKDEGIRRLLETALETVGGKD